MNSEKDITSSSIHKLQSSHDDELSLVELYLIIKRNGKIFFAIILLSLLISLFVIYKYQSKTSNDIASNSQGITTEYVLLMEIGMVFGGNTGKTLIERPVDTLEKLRRIYIPKVVSEFGKSKAYKINKASIFASRVKKTHLISIKTSDKLNHSEVLLSIAKHVLDDHKWIMGAENKLFFIKPTSIIQKPLANVIEYNIIKKNYKYVIIIPIIGIIIGIFLSFFVIFIREFLKKVREIEGTT